MEEVHAGVSTARDHRQETFSKSTTVTRFNRWTSIPANFVRTMFGHADMARWRNILADSYFWFVCFRE